MLRSPPRPSRIEIVDRAANAAAISAGLSPTEADAATADYADAQLEALKKAMLAVALLALLSSCSRAACRANRRQQGRERRTGRHAESSTATDRLPQLEERSSRLRHRSTDAASPISVALRTATAAWLVRRSVGSERRLAAVMLVWAGTRQ